MRPIPEEPPALDFQLLFNSAPELYLVLTPDLTIVAASDAYLRATKTERNSIVGRGMFEAFPDGADEPTSAGPRNLRASLAAVLRTGTPQAMTVQKYSIRRRGTGGGRLKECYWSAVNSPVVGADGGTAFIIHRVEDVTAFMQLKGPDHRPELADQGVEATVVRPTPDAQDASRQADVSQGQREAQLRRERERAEAARHNTDERYRALFENAPDGIVIADRQSYYIDANPSICRMLGYLREELIGLHASDIVTEREVPHIQSALGTITSTADYHREWEFRRKDGSVFQADVIATAMPDGNLLGMIRDVSQQRNLEDQYRQAQKMEAVGQLAGGVAHDFNNLLTVILGYCGLLVADSTPDDPRLAAIVEIQNAGAQASELTRQLLAFSRKQIIEPALLHLNQIMADLRTMLERLIGEDVQVVFRPEPALALIRADRTQIEQILMNLAVNARDAMPAGGTLTIETANVQLDAHYASTHVGVTPGPYVLLTVTDTGTGMTAEVQARLFEPFFTTKEAGKGTGLGMATVYGIVTGSGGTVGVQSELGKGSAFRVYFPAADDMDLDLVVQTNVPAAEPLTGTQTILVVEDENGVRLLARKLLERQGYTVIVAASVAEALVLFDANPSIDLVLTDVVMPGASGPELIRQLLDRRPALKVIYMSGYNEDVIVKHGVLEPGIAFLNKPFTSRSLGQKIRDVFAH